MKLDYYRIGAINSVSIQPAIHWFIRWYLSNVCRQ